MSIRKQMDEYLSKCFSKFKTQITDSGVFRENCLKEFKKYYKEREHKEAMNISSKYFQFVIITIKDNKVDIVHEYKQSELIDHIITLIKKTINYCIDNNKVIPDTKMYFWISDRFPWELGNIINEYPFYVFASPKHSRCLIFPDNTFECITLDKKYKGKCFDWDHIKKLFAEKNKEYKEKQKVIYFKGTPTTNKIHRIREILHKYALNRTNMLILLDGWNNYTPIMDNSKYLFLLNLPGHYPWSNRFKYLFLTNSVIININVFTQAISKDGWNDDEYYSFIDLIMKPNKDYFDLKFTYYTAGKSNSIDLQNKAKQMTHNEINNVISKIENIYSNYTKNKTKYDKMIKNYRQKIDKLTNETVYEYIYKCIVYNSKVVVG